MSAIFGLFHRTGRPVDCDDLGRMSETLAHRGPDGQGLWSGGPTGLGHRMLWTTPESLREQLPLAREAAGLAITADARIDNREELLPLLGLTDRPAGEIADSEVILAAYEKWGEGCPEHLLGDFAFAIWDTREQKLFCARDHFGVKPFYYHASDSVFVFGTEIKALFCLPEVPHDLNDIRVAEHLAALDTGDVSDTLYRGVRCLSPGHSIMVDAVRVATWRYWGLDPTKALKLGSDGEYAERFRELFSEAVRCRLRSAFPVGSALSGGMDSSSITCVAHGLSGASAARPWPTFTAICPDVPECDERNYVDSVLSQGSYAPTYLRSDLIRPLDELDLLLWHLDGGEVPGNLFEGWGLYRAASRSGVRVLLDGFDGDNVVSHGSGYFYELAGQRRWLELAVELRGYATHVSEEPWGQAFLWWLRVHALGPAASRYWPLSVLRRLKKRLKAGRGREGTATSGGGKYAHLNPEFLKRSGLLERRALDSPKTEREQHHRALTEFMPSVIMEIINKTAGAHSVEVRFPFMDKRLVEFCLSLPPGQKIRRGWTRVILRHAMEGILPPQVQRRRGKTSYMPNFRRRLLRVGADDLAQPVVRNADRMRQYVVLPEVPAGETLISDQASDMTVLLFWQTLTLALWLERMSSAVFDRPGKEVMR